MNEVDRDEEVLEELFFNLVIYADKKSSSMAEVCESAHSNRLVHVPWTKYVPLLISQHPFMIPSWNFYQLVAYVSRMPKII